MVQEEERGQRRTHAQRHKYGGQPQIKDSGARCQLLLALKGIGKEGREKQRAARGKQRQDAPDECRRKRDFYNGEPTR